MLEVTGFNEYNIKLDGVIGNNTIYKNRKIEGLNVHHPTWRTGSRCEFNRF